MLVVYNPFISLIKMFSEINYMLFVFDYHNIIKFEIIDIHLTISGVNIVKEDASVVFKEIRSVL